MGDPLAQTFPDELHSEEEQRYIAPGVSSRYRLLFLSHAEEGDSIRITGARAATGSERTLYEELQSRP